MRCDSVSRVVPWMLCLAAAGCQPTPPRAPGATTAASAPATVEANAARLAAVESQIAGLDERLQRIETLIRRATGEEPEPDPSAVYSVPIDGLPFVGPRDAKVTVVMAYEFACAYCAQIAPTMRQLVANHRGDVKVVYAPYIVHVEEAVLPALAACAANEQGKFAQMESILWQKAWGDRDLSDDRLTALAGEIGLDMERYHRDMAGDQCIGSIKRSVSSLSRVGTQGTPTFYINGRFLLGAQPIESFRELIAQELAKANRVIAGGVAARDYYQKTVVEGGKTSL